MDQSKKKKLLYGVIGITLFVVGLILLIIGCTIKRPTVTFLNYDNTVLGESKVVIGNTAVYQGQKPTKESDENGYVYIFVGWEPSVENIQKSITVTAQFEKTPANYTITLDPNGGNVSSELTIKYTVEDTVSLPTPVKEGCTFEGWYENNNFSGTPKYSLSKGNYDNKTLYAKWSAPSRSLNYELNGGESDKLPNSYTILDNITLPTPKKDGFVFGGWYTTSTFDVESKVTKVGNNVDNGDLTLYAEWVCKIEYELNGGILDRQAVKTFNEIKETTLPLPTKIGYQFVGWYDNQELTGDKVEFIPAGITNDMKFYAKWENVPEGVIFEENGYKYLYFGSYAQTVVTEKKLIDELKKVVNKNTNKAEYEGNVYYHIKAEPAATVYRFDHTLEDNYLKDGDLITKNEYFFKVEPIKWRVLDTADGKITLLSEYVLDYQLFDSTSNNYETSFIREWLNNTFLNTAFTKEQQEKILTTEVKNVATSTSNSNNLYACKNTLDKVFLLSYEETVNIKYGFNSDFSQQDEAKAAVATEYVRALGLKMTTAYMYYGNTSWMLRSPFTVAKSISLINGIMTSQNTKLNYIEKYASGTEKYGVRPAIVIEG